MVVYCVDVFVKKGNEKEFIEATRLNHLATRKEEGNVRFDLSRDPKDSGLFFLYEVYDDEEAVAYHKTTEHYKKWRETVEPWMDKPRSGRMFKPLLPDSIKGW